MVPSVRRCVGCQRSDDSRVLLRCHVDVKKSSCCHVPFTYRASRGMAPCRRPTITGVFLGNGEGSLRVVYISGWGRSGTTVVDRLLGQLPGFCSVGELRSLWDCDPVSRSCSAAARSQSANCGHRPCAKRSAASSAMGSPRCGISATVRAGAAMFPSVGHRRLCTGPQARSPWSTATGSKPCTVRWRGAPAPTPSWTRRSIRRRRSCWPAAAESRCTSSTWCATTWSRVLLDTLPTAARVRQRRAARAGRAVEHGLVGGLEPGHRVGVGTAAGRAVPPRPI